jgi:hypothetical protein
MKIFLILKKLSKEMAVIGQLCDTEYVLLTISYQTTAEYINNKSRTLL